MAKYTCSETKIIILKLIAEGNIGKAQYIQSLRKGRNIIVRPPSNKVEMKKGDFNNETKQIKSFKDSNIYWSNLKRKIRVILPKFPDDED